MNRLQAFLYKITHSKGKARTFFKPDAAIHLRPLDRAILACVGVGLSLIPASGAILVFLNSNPSSSFLPLIAIAALVSAVFFTALNIFQDSRIIAIPSALAEGSYEASELIEKIKALASEPTIGNDPDALGLASRACELYDDFTFDLHKAFRADPASFEAYSILEVKENPSSEVYLLIKELLSPVDTLRSVSLNLLALINSKREEEEVRAQAQRLENATLILERMRFGKTSSTRNQIEESLGDLKLREDIKKKSLDEIKDLIRAQES